MSTNIGEIKQILGAVIDVSFKDQLPEILNALTVEHENKELILEVAQHLGDNCNGLYRWINSRTESK